MKRNISVRMLVLCLILLVFAPNCPAGENNDAKGKNFLWKVSSKTGTTYILGSVHLAKPDIYPLPRNIEQCFDKSEILAVEADPGKAKDPAVLQMMLLVALYKGDDTLQQHLSKKTYDLAAQEIRQLGLPLEQFNKAKPWFLALTIEALEFQRLGYDQEHGIDKYFAGKARDKKKLVELESFDYQIKMLDGFSDREQDLFLFYTLQDLKSLQDVIEELMRAWRTGDATAMESLVTKTLRDYPQIQPIFDKLFFQRNREMAGKIEQFLEKKNTVFVVVGAAHLVGKKGIISLLKDKGYQVEQQ